MTDPYVIEQEGERILNTYFDKEKIKDTGKLSDEEMKLPKREREKLSLQRQSKEFLRQVNRMKGLGIIQQLKENYTIGNKLFKQMGLGSLKRKNFKEFNFGPIQKSLSGTLKAVVQNTGKRQVLSVYKGRINAFEKWKDGVVYKVGRDKLGRFR